MSSPSFTKIIVLTVGVLILAGIIRALVISSLWNWFIASAFHVPEMSMVTALGVSMLASLFMQPPSKADTEGKEWGEIISREIGSAVFAPLITLALGWALHALTY